MNDQQESGKISILTAVFAYTAKQIEINRNKSWQLIVWYFVIYFDMHKFSQAHDLEILQKKDKKFDERKKFGYIDLDEKFMFAVALFFISIFYLIISSYHTHLELYSTYSLILLFLFLLLLKNDKMIR